MFKSLKMNDKGILHIIPYLIATAKISTFQRKNQVRNLSLSSGCGLQQFAIVYYGAEVRLFAKIPIFRNLLWTCP